MKNRSQRYGINRPKHGYKCTKYKRCLSNAKATFEAQFMKKLRKTGDALKKRCL